MPYALRRACFLLFLLLTAPVLAWAQASCDPALTTGISAWLQLDEQTGTTAADVSGANKTGQLLGTYSWQPGGGEPKDINLNSSTYNATKWELNGKSADCQ